METFRDGRSVTITGQRADLKALAPSHTDGDATEVAAYVAMLRRIREQVGALIAQGRTVDEVVAARLLADDRSPTTPGPDNRDQFIRTLYEALKTGQGR
jgi:hypothetical protein